MRTGVALFLLLAAGGARSMATVPAPPFAEHYTSRRVERSLERSSILARQPGQSVTPTTASGTPVLPPTRPTESKGAAPTNAIPALPSPLPAGVGARVAPRPQRTAGTLPSPGNAGAQAALLQAARSGLTGQTSSLPETSAQALRDHPVVPANAAVAGSASSASTTQPIVSNQAPGPSLNTPVTLTMAPNELRVAGLGSSSSPWGIVVLLTLLTLLPSILICVTPFARLLVVFHFLRQALGLQTTPSNQTLIGLTLILTFFIMEPVGRQIYETSVVPLQSGQITAFEALARGKEPMKKFMSHYVREKDAELFLEIAKEPRPHDMNDLSMRVLVPAYIVSELKSGFQIGAVLFLPFLVVDMVVASITTSVGMMQLPPVVISTPLKLLLFLMVDGWHLLIGALVRSFS